jgi:hypothetical protein
MWVGPSLPLLWTSLRKPSPTPIFPSPFSHTPHCSAPRWPLLRPPLPVASSPRSSCAKSLPAAPASKAEPRDFPVVIFLHEHLTGDSPLRLFPHPANPTGSSSLPRSSSSTTSSATSTTPSASHRCLLPVNACTAVEVPVSTPFPTSPPRFSCGGM